MKEREKTRKLLAEHYQRYPDLQIQDVFKFIYQSACGCEHLVSDVNEAVLRIRAEWESHTMESGCRADALDGDYSRIHLSYLDEGLSAETLGKLFAASAKKEQNSLWKIQNKLSVARELVGENALPFSPEEFDKAAEEWKEQGCPAIHHSNRFREAYRPAYRVIASRYAAFLPIFSKMDQLLQKGWAVVAIDGGSASGKTTLSEMLAAVYDCTVFHMDDFFLRPEQRTPERYAETGGNVDRERFLEEVLIPLSRNEPVSYRKFDCATFTLGPPIEPDLKKLVIIEGAYSMHPELADYYDASVFLDVAPELQKKRIEKRNSPQLARRFFEEWIPLEAAYFSKMQVKARCDILVAIDE